MLFRRLERVPQRGDSGGVCSWQEHKSRQIKKASRLRVVWFNKVPAKDCGLSPAIWLGPIARHRGPGRALLRTPDPAPPSAWRSPQYNRENDCMIAQRVSKANA